MFLSWHGLARTIPTASPKIAPKRTYDSKFCNKQSARCNSSAADSGCVSRYHAVDKHVLRNFDSVWLLSKVNLLKNGGVAGCLPTQWQSWNIPRIPFRLLGCNQLRLRSTYWFTAHFFIQTLGKYRPMLGGSFIKCTKRACSLEFSSGFNWISIPFNSIDFVGALRLVRFQMMKNNNHNW